MDNIQFILLDLKPTVIKEWKFALAQHVPDRFQANISIVQSELADLGAPHNQFDCIVSPANSYGHLDGG
jgi:hypothetical protein